MVVTWSGTYLFLKSRLESCLIYDQSIQPVEGRQDHIKWYEERSLKEVDGSYLLEHLNTQLLHAKY